MLTRRGFLTITGSTLLAGRFHWPAEDQVPAMLDHLLLGSADLDQGIAFFERETGIRAAFGGVHPGRGTRNALLSLGERRYLEIIAPDPAQIKIPHFDDPMVDLLKSLPAPRLIGWAAHCDDIAALAGKLKRVGIAFDGPRDGSRARPDGRLLKWKTLNLKDTHDGVLPFFIQWDPSSPHPSTDAPAGCRLERFSIADPNPAGLQKTCQQLGLDVRIETGNQSQLRASFAREQQIYDVTS